MNNPKKNFFYNCIYQILVLIIPLITAPYLARIVGSKGVGIYSYRYSIVYYFMLITMLGVNNYGNRSIAKVRDNKKKLSSTFLSIYLFQLIIGVLMLVIYVIYILLFPIEYKNIAIIQTLFIISAILDINWFFFGMEQFKKTITRNSFVKIGTVFLIFLFVKTENDLWKYCLIMAGTTCISQLILWFFISKEINFVKISLVDVSKHVKPNIMLFIPVISVSLYRMMDKVMLGLMTNVNEVGYYENAEKIIAMPLTFINALGTVMLPRMSNIVEKGKMNIVTNYLEKSIKFVTFLSLAMFLGLVGIGQIFAPVFFGNDFLKTGLLIQLLSITIPFISITHVVRTQYLMPFSKDKSYIFTSTTGAITNLLINLLLIPKFSSVGACIGTIFTEIVVCFAQCIVAKRDVKIFSYLGKSIIFLPKAIFMYLVVYLISFLSISKIFIIIFQIIAGITIYLVLNIKYINSIVDLKKIYKKVKKL